jgi:UDP-GlcNAc:undecaprenyl-phosphate GlcNAc-1-phosphate transferase
MVGLVVSFLLIPVILEVARRNRLFQRPADLHHTHTTPVPRVGGLALAIAFLAVEGFILIFYPERRGGASSRLVVVLSSLAMFGLGFWDDLRPLGARRKLMGQVLIASCVYFCGIGIQVLKIPFTDTTLELGGWGMVLTILWLVGMANLINLIDGVDGLAGGICLMLMILMALVGHDGGSYSALASGMAGALLAFLLFNFPPARIYMGDGGAYFLGFQIGLYSLVNSHKGTVFVALVAPLFVLALPIADTALAILRRGLRGLPIFRPDKKHIHHRLIELGFSRRRVVLSIYAVTLVFLGLGAAAYWSRGQLLPVLLGIAALILAVCAGNLRFSREWFAVGRVVGNSLGMRQQIQYTLSLTRWLELEADRHQTLDGFWTDFSFACRKLGFAEVKVTLADGHRSWEGSNRVGSRQLFRHDVGNGHYGTVEFSAPACPLAGGTLHGDCAREEECSLSAGSCLANSRVAEIVSELLAEAWGKAAAKFSLGMPVSLRFDTPKPELGAVPTGKWPAGIYPVRRQAQPSS